MKHTLRLLHLSIVFAACISQSEALAQMPFSVFAAEETTLPGYHTDSGAFQPGAPLDTTRPINSMSLQLVLHGMNQLQANGQPTVFRTNVSAADAPNDSHFLLDPQQFTVLSASENGNLLQADIEFTAPFVFPSPFPLLVQAVAFDGHSEPGGMTHGSLTVTGLYTDGGRFSFQATIIPEPNSVVLAVLCVGLCNCTRQRTSRIRGLAAASGL